MIGGFSTQKRIGIFGGSFDPVHMGHLIMAQDALERLELSSIIFVPALTPPHKQHVRQVSAEHRLNMLRLALESDLRFDVSDIEICRGGVSYSIDTVRALKKQNPDAELVLIVGSDTLVDLHNWRSAEVLLQECEVASFVRPGEDVISSIADQIGFEAEVKERLLGNLIEAHRVEISSTDIRMRLAEGLSIRYLVPPEVEMYIFEHGLYSG